MMKKTKALKSKKLLRKPLKEVEDVESLLPEVCGA
jgi:hypothetical protein